MMESSGLTTESVPAIGASGSPRRPTRRNFGGLVSSAIVVAIAVAFAAPALVVLWRTLRLGASLGDAVAELPGPLWRTVQLAVLVSATAAIVGTLLAWLVVRTDLPGRRAWRVLLVLPLVLPSFIGAAAFIAGLAPGGLLNDLFGLFGLEPPRRFRGLGASWLVLSLFTYPYVMLPVSARLIAVPPTLEESARMLGRSSWSAFRSVTLPQLRAAVLGGTLLVCLYTVSEFGAVQLLGYDTLTRVVYATRQVDRAQSFLTASVVVVLAVGVVVLERSVRGRATPDVAASSRPVPVLRLGAGRVPALLACVVVAGLGVVVPVASLGRWAVRGFDRGVVRLGDLVSPAWNTAVVAVVAAVLAVVVVLPVAVATTRRASTSSRVAAVAVVGGFAVPGLVTALALAYLTLNTPALSGLYQTSALLLVAYVGHFGSQALTPAEQAVRAVPSTLRESSRLLEPSRTRRFLTVELPLMTPGLLAGGGLVLLAVVKELPATLLLAPIGFTTLATEVWGAYEEGFYAEAGAASLALIALSAVLTWSLVLRRSMLVTG